MEDELISINVWLAGRSYRIRIRAQEEEAVRKAVRIAEEKIRDMRTHYAGKDDQDFLSMVLLTYAADSSLESFDWPLVQETMRDLNAKIQETLDGDTHASENLK